MRSLRRQDICTGGCKRDIKAQQETVINRRSGSTQGNGRLAGEKSRASRERGAKRRKSRGRVYQLRRKEDEKTMGYRDLKFEKDALFLVTGGAGFFGSNLFEAVFGMG